MKETIANFNKYLIENLPLTYPDQVSLGQPLNYEDLEDYIVISWSGSNEKESANNKRKSAQCHVECFSRKGNLYSHFEMAGNVVELLKHLVALPNGTVRISDVQMNFMDLEGIRKADILFTIYDDEVV